MRSPLRVANPAGFLCVLGLFLLLPFVAVSCDTADQPGSKHHGAIEATYSGTALLRNETTVEPTGEFAGEPEQNARIYEPISKAGTPARVLAVATVVLLLVGVATALIRSPRARLRAALALATIALVCIVLTQIFATHHLRAVIERDFAPWMTELDDVAPLLPRSGEVVQVRIGYPATAIPLAAIAGLNAFVLLRRRKATT